MNFYSIDTLWKQSAEWDVSWDDDLQCFMIDNYYEDPEGIYNHLQKRDIPLWKYILYGQKRLFSIHQADFYFWIGLGLILEIGEYITWMLFVVLFIRVINRIKSRYFYLKLLDKLD